MPVKLPESTRRLPVSTVYVTLLGMLLLAFANRPLWHTDLWDHINYGQQILRQGSLPATEPLLALAAGVPFVNTAWLAQLSMASLYDHLGLAGIQFAFGLVVAMSVGTITCAVARRSRSAGFGILGGGVFLWINLQQLLAVRPQLVGVLFFNILISVLMTGGPKQTASWLLFPLMFAVWANCHGSFGVGLAVMALTGAGNWISVLWRSRSLALACRSRRFARLFWLTQLCAAAVLMNPYGLEIYHAVLKVGSHPNVATMFEWDALSLRMKQGQVAAAMVCLLLISVTLSPRRVQAEEAVLLLVTGGLALWSSRMINWWAPAMALSIATHGAAAWRTVTGRCRTTHTHRRRGVWTVVNIGLCMVFCSLTNLGAQVIYGEAPDPRRALSKQTPLESIGFLNSLKSLPPGIAFVPAEWSGVTTQLGPRDLRPMVNLHVHVIPEQIWTDYLRLLAGSPDSSHLLNRYDINLMIADKSRNARLITRTLDSGDWIIRHEDAHSVVLQRE